MGTCARSDTEVLCPSAMMIGDLRSETVLGRETGTIMLGIDPLQHPVRCAAGVVGVWHAKPVLPPWEASIVPAFRSTPALKARVGPPRTEGDRRRSQHELRVKRSPVGVGRLRRNAVIESNPAQ